MLYRFLADSTAVIHLVFVAFVVGGGWLVMRRPIWAVAHLPAAVWGVAIECGGWVCPLTPLENWFRMQAGVAGYQGGFVEHYVLPVLYPSGLTREVQIALAAGVLAINVVLYGAAWRRYRRLERS